MHSAFDSLLDLQARNLSGFCAVATLWQLLPALDVVPDQPGIYCIVKPDPTPPVFLSQSPAGHFEGDPTVPVSDLQHKWVADTRVLYVGQTGRTLRTRITELLRFGRGEPVGHKGGRYVWQLANAAQLLICWRVVAGSPEDEKQQLIANFRERFAVAPFANLVG